MEIRSFHKSLPSAIYATLPTTAGNPDPYFASIIDATYTTIPTTGVGKMKPKNGADIKSLPSAIYPTVPITAAVIFSNVLT